MGKYRIYARLSIDYGQAEIEADSQEAALDIAADLPDDQWAHSVGNWVDYEVLSVEVVEK